MSNFNFSIDKKMLLLPVLQPKKKLEVHTYNYGMHKSRHGPQPYAFVCGKKEIFKARKLGNIKKNATDANAAGSKMLTFTCNKKGSLDICSLEPREINNLQLKGP